MKRIIGKHLFPFTAVALLTAGLEARAQSKADYHDVAEMEAALLALDGGAGGRMKVHHIGNSEWGQPIYAVQLAAVQSTGNPLPDEGEKPALMIEAGMHAREWAGPELSLMFLKAFSLGAALDPSRIDGILDEATIWVLPMVNPGGRGFDDQHGGDPTRFWTSNFFHDNDVAGWRTNLTPTCPAAPAWGIDLARNFSAGWNVPSEKPEWKCRSVKYHGKAPFQAQESNVMRRFVNNRMISMSLSIHSFGGTLGTISSDHTIRDQFVNDVWNKATQAAPLLQLVAGNPSGKGSGQFPAWLSQPSNTHGYPDVDTRRGVNSLLLELPPKHDKYEGSDSQWKPGDGSNGFHPSSQTFLEDTFDGFFKGLMYLAEQARSPWCSIDPTTLQPHANGPDFGLTGSKIARSKDDVGALAFRFHGDYAEEVLVARKRNIVYRVQNFGHATTNAETVQVKVIVRSDPSSPAFSVPFYHTLSPGEAATGEVPYDFHAGKSYTVFITARPWSYHVTGERVTENDLHIFKFRAIQFDPSVYDQPASPGNPIPEVLPGIQ